MSILKKLFGREPKPEDASDARTVRRIGRVLETLPPDRAKALAAFAFVLARTAHADLDVSDEETAAMERIVRKTGGLGAAEAALAVEIARNESRLFGGTENFVVTRAVAASLDRGEREALLRCLFDIAAADLTISSIEDAELRKISAELGFSHREFVAIRASYSSHRAALKGLPTAQVAPPTNRRRTKR